MKRGKWKYNKNKKNKKKGKIEFLIICLRIKAFK